MTERQKQIYNYIVEYIENHGYSPTIREICSGCYTTAYGYIRETLWKLELKGYIKIEDGKRRTITIVKHE